MLAAVSQERAAIERGPRSLQAEFYTDPAIFEAELEHVLRPACWWFAGHSSRAATPGQRFTLRLGTDSVIVTRAEDGTLHAMHNVCRHRGMQLVDIEELGVICDGDATSSSSSPMLRCPYHGWVYDLTGKLLHARNMQQDFDPTQVALAPVHVREVEGAIFLCLATEEPPDYSAVFESFARYMAPHSLKPPHARIARRSSHLARANWKVVCENFWECYHCPTSHPEFSDVMQYSRAVGGADPRAVAELSRLQSEWSEKARRLGHLVGDEGVSARAAAVGNAVGLSCNRIPIRAGFETQSQTGRLVAPLMGDFRDRPDGGVTGLQCFPMNWFALSNDHAYMFRVTPLSVCETEIEMSTIVRGDAVAGVDYEVDECDWLWRVTLEQDLELCERTQAGIESSVYAPGPHSLDETSVGQFLQWALGLLESGLRAKEGAWSDEATPHARALGGASGDADGPRM